MDPVTTFILISLSVLPVADFPALLIYLQVLSTQMHRTPGRPSNHPDGHSSFFLPWPSPCFSQSSAGLLFVLYPRLNSSKSSLILLLHPLPCCQVHSFLPSKYHPLDSVFHPHLSSGLYHSTQRLLPQLLSFYLPNYRPCSFQSILCKTDRFSFLKHYFSSSDWLRDVPNVINCHK